MFFRLWKFHFSFLEDALRINTSCFRLDLIIYFVLNGVKQAYIQQLETRRISLAQLEQEMQMARTQVNRDR
jgi:hypothetical protein